jgi:hypothetical protein
LTTNEAVVTRLCGSQKSSAWLISNMARIIHSFDQ